MSVTLWKLQCLRPARTPRDCAVSYIVASALHFEANVGRIFISFQINLATVRQLGGLVFELLEWSVFSAAMRWGGGSSSTADVDYDSNFVQ